MGSQQQIHEMRQRAHQAGIPGSSKMSEQQLKDAMKKVDKGMDPAMAKQKAKS
ncbi:hypothetical protein GCM10027290_63750 [Micromonospora sonneratiae]|uniref:MT0933-like antitoxin protein n=1 Tax=Micromonospora sonneratiae TaxID=1184706 RepID=A0ABW3YHT5_9ACTN